MSKDLNGQQVGMSPTSDVNNPRPNIPRGYNQFPQSYQHLTTESYGLYQPFFHVKCERGDIQNLNSEHSLHTYTLQSPMVGKLKKTKSYIKVPMQAIYPRNWEKMFTIPTQGDDVPADTRALLDVSGLVHNLLSFFDGFSSTVKLRALALLELITSHGSLFEKFNMHLNYAFESDNPSPDFFFNNLWKDVANFGKNHALIDSDDVRYLVRTNDQDTSSQMLRYVSESRFIELIRRGDLFTTDGWDEDFDWTVVIPSVIEGYNSEPYSNLDPYQNYLNIEPIISYQLALAQFGTNDFVDFVYSAQLYRDNMQALLMISLNGANFPHFSYNGVSYLYDVFSLRCLDELIAALASDDSDVYSSAIDFFLNLFNYVPSLRYGDYFTGSKPQPLAVGEYTARVNNNEVSAIDITRSIQMQRLLHRVNMVGRKLGDYLSGIFGGKLPEASKDVPIFLSHQNFDVEGFETNNTGALQFDEDAPNTITTNLRSTKDKFAFEVTIDEPCYIIGVSSYAMQRVYSRTMDRFAFHHDRYDDFIPEMQYIGDQDIRARELDSLFPPELPFAYCLRYMEYKQRYSYASGGFIDKLPSWSFVTDNQDGNPADYKISPDYIRSSPSEFDRFYKSLTDLSLGGRFHFIVAYTNHTSPLRRMEYTPEILK